MAKETTENIELVVGEELITRHILEEGLLREPI